MNFREIAKKATTQSALMIDKTAYKQKELIAEHPDGVTITAFDYIHNKKGEKYPVFTIAEEPDKFVNGGTVINSIFKEFVDYEHGDIDAASRELAREGGLKCRFFWGNNKAGDDTVLVEVL